MVVEEVPVAIGEGVDMLIQIVALRHRIEGTEPCHAFHMHPLIASGDETDVGNSIGKGPRSSFPSRSPTEGCVPSGLAGSMERLKKNGRHQEKHRINSWTCIVQLEYVIRRTIYVSDIDHQVVRGGRRIEVSIFDIVVGDIIPLKIGGYPPFYCDEPMTTYRKAVKLHGMLLLWRPEKHQLKL